MSPDLTKKPRGFWRARIGDRTTDGYSVRPPNSIKDCGGPRVCMGSTVGADDGQCDEPVFPVDEDGKGDELGDDMLCAP